MPYIVVNGHQAAEIAADGDAVEVRDQSGRLLGHIEARVPPEEIAIAKARRGLPGPRYTIDQVVAHLQSLEGK